jgi:ribosomal protein S19
MKKISYLNLFKYISKINKKINIEHYIKIFDRNLKINHFMIGLNIAVYNGHYFIPLKITENMVGNLIGSFAFPCKILLKSKKKTRVKSKTKKK